MVAGVKRRWREGDEEEDGQIWNLIQARLRLECSSEDETVKISFHEVRPGLATSMWVFP